MSIPARSINNPLALIAVLAATTEASALASLPLLDHRNQSVFVWFLVGFPPFLTILFFITLNFNRSALAGDSAAPVASMEDATDALLAEAQATYATPLAAAFTLGCPGSPLQQEIRANTGAHLHVLEYANEADWQALHPRLCAWADDVLTQPYAADTPTVMLVLPTRG